MAVLGIVGTLVAAVLTQILTNRREFRRDQLRWAQERQQRELDSQKAAFAESLLAFDKWHTEVYALHMHLMASVIRKGDAARFPELEEAARSGQVAVQLVCSKEAVKATSEALAAVWAMGFAVGRVVSSVQRDGEVDEDLYFRANGMASTASDAMIELRKVYRAELAKLAAEPVVLPQKPRRRLSLPWRKSA